MSKIDANDPAADAEPTASTRTPADPFGGLPSLSRRQARLAMRLARADSTLAGPVGWLAEVLGEPLPLGSVEILNRGAGLRRSGAIAQLSWPRLGTRIGLGVEPALAHAIVDRLLGFERFAAEERLQVTPVEWGILSFVLARSLEGLDRSPGPLGPWDLTIDRVGPEPFDQSGLGTLSTLAWAVRVGKTRGTLRLWVPESVIAMALVDDDLPAQELQLDLDQWRSRFGLLESLWKAEAGSVTLAKGLSSLRKGSVQPMAGTPLRGSVNTPSGPIALTLRDAKNRYWFAATAVADSGGGRLILNSGLQREPENRNRSREVIAMSTPPVSSSTDSGLNPAEAPVTLTVELGKVSLPLSRLADLKPGDVLELARHVREPVELTTGGKLVARGELIQIDTELGVRITHVFL